MKRIFLPLLAALCLLAGCMQTGAAGFAEDDLLLNIGGESYRCKTDIQTVIGALGEDYDYAQGKSCAYDGLDKTFTYETAQFFTNPLEAGDIVSEIYTESPEVSTSKGICVGAAKADVLAAYGEPAGDDGSLLIYRVSETWQAGEMSLCFELEGDTVAAIFLTTEAI